MDTQTPDQDELRKVKEEIVKLAHELRDRIPSWVSAVKMEFTTATFGILGKCSIYMEQLLKNVLLLLQYRRVTTENQLPIASPTDKLTLGEVVRLIKKQQNEAEIFRQADKLEVGRMFSLLDEIVVLRNKLIHVKFGGSSRQAARNLHAFLKCADQFCNSWMLGKLLGAY